MTEESVKVRKKYDRFSILYDLSEKLIENNLYSNWRKRSLKELRGNVLEIGIGTGKNLRYYHEDVKLKGIDISPKMLARAMKKNKEQHINADLRVMDAQHLEFKDNVFDYVVVTFVLCSIPDPIMALKEIKRVLKNEGKFIAMEHVLSKNPVIALWEKIHNPITVGLFGVHVDRDTRSNIEKSGLKIISDENLAIKDVFRLFECKL